MEEPYVDGQLSCSLIDNESYTSVDPSLSSSAHSKSQKRVDRQQRRRERRQKKAELMKPRSSSQSILQSMLDASQDQPKPKRRKSLPGFLGKHRHEIHAWLKHYLFMHSRADDAGVQYIRDMDDEQRAKFVQEYVDVAEFLDKLKEYLDEESLKKSSQSKCK